MINQFEKYKLNPVAGLTELNDTISEETMNESFLLFKSLFNIHYGSIVEDGNLISIHTGGWSENEDLIRQFRYSAWWFIHIRITKTGGHYYFDTVMHFKGEYSGKKWKIVAE